MSRHLSEVRQGSDPRPRSENAPEWWPSGGPERWMQTMADDHRMMVMAHERAVGAKIGELKGKPGKAAVEKALREMRRDGELTSQKPEYEERESHDFLHNRPLARRLFAASEPDDGKSGGKVTT